MTEVFGLAINWALLDSFHYETDHFSAFFHLGSVWFLSHWLHCSNVV